MRVLTPEEMREADRIAMHELGVPGLDLMERAGSEVGRALRDRYGASGKRVVVLCGKGNNGGDGLVAARWLAARGALVEVFLFSVGSELSGDAAANRGALVPLPIPVHEVPDGSRDAFVSGRVERADVVVDALLGTGFSGPPQGRLAEAIALCRRARCPVVAVDIPSGINGLSGLAAGEAVRADLTVTLAAPKLGLYLHPGRAHAGEIVVAPIGIPEEALARAAGKTSLFGEDDARVLHAPRPRDAHKGRFGRVLVAGGAPDYTGAPLLAGRAALRAGAGLVTLGVPASIRAQVASRVEELMTRALPDRDGVHTEEGASQLLADRARFDVLAVGPGLGRGAAQSAFVARLLEGWGGPLVLDADGLHALAGRKAVVAASGARLVLTPHLGEMEALTGVPRAEILEGRAAFVRTWSAELRSVLLLKGNPTLVASPDGAVTLNTTGNPGMATAGSGDVLTGVIAALLGCGLAPADAARMGVWLHGRAGDRAAERSGEDGLIAGDIIEAIPEVLLALEKGEAAR
jgi:NAD(P)H-hydrate epimerase